MRQLAPSELLELWERTTAAPSGERPLLLAAAARPDAAPEQLADLPIGERDALLIRLRERNFGGRVETVARCPACTEMLEIDLDLAQLGAAQPAAGAREHRIAVGEVAIDYRLPSTRDLSRIAAESDPARARALLLAQVVVSARRGGEPIAVEALPEEAIAALEQRLEEDDPLADVRIALRCPACAHGWSAPFEITSFLLDGIAVRARRLLDEVHALASAYHWSEREILALSPQRRRIYLERVAR